MKPPDFQYHDPRTLAEAVRLLGSLENAKLLAGGQSLMPMLNMRFVLPDHVVDLNRIDELAYVRESSGVLEIGASAKDAREPPTPEKLFVDLGAIIANGLEPERPGVARLSPRLVRNIKGLHRPRARRRQGRCLRDRGQQ